MSKEYSRLDEVAHDFNEHRTLENDLKSAEELRNSSDLEMRALADDEYKALVERRAALERRLLTHLVPKDPHDDANLFLEVRAGTGGDEAAIFAGDLFRMYARYAERQGWQRRDSVASARRARRLQGDHRARRGQGRLLAAQIRVRRAPRAARAGYRGARAHPYFGLHRRHFAGGGRNRRRSRSTRRSASVDTFRASGAGGQHVNKTDSAIRITHLPTGIVVECQDERSQHKNRARAMSLLNARMRDAEETKRHNETAEKRRAACVGTGDRSERIRTYNFPQGRLTDHRINLTLYKLEDIVNGELDDVIGPLANEYQADMLSSLGLES